MLYALNFVSRGGKIGGDDHLHTISTSSSRGHFHRESMPEFQQAQLDAYLSKVLEAVVRGDKAALRRFGHKDGFINNRIRRFVWYMHFVIVAHSRPCLLDCSDCEYAPYSDIPLQFPDLDERDKITIQQDVRRSFTRFPGKTSFCAL